jgi:ParB family transcriptional regulator, chromosome partitioning protein
LTASEKALFTRRRKEAYEALHPETAHGKASPNKDANLAPFHKDTASKTGESERTVQRNAERGE